MHSAIGRKRYAALKCESRPCLVMRAVGLGTTMGTAACEQTLGELSDGCGGEAVASPSCLFFFQVNEMPPDVSPCQTCAVPQISTTFTFPPR